MIRFPESFAFITDEVSQDPRDAVRFAARHDLTQVELRSAFGRQFRELTDTDVAELKKRFADAGLTVVACDTPVFKCALGDVAALRVHRELFRRSIEIAQTLDAPLLRVFTFLRDKRALSDARTREIAEHLNQLAEQLPPRMALGVENEASCQVATAAETARLFELLPSPRIGIVWDPCNVLYVPGPPSSIHEGFAAIAPRVIHVHAKDAARAGATAVAAPLGTGDVDWPGEFRALTAAGYDGPVSLETHWRQTALAESALHLPGGFAFSHGGAAASEACLRALPALLSQGAT
ncbi:MAG: sugar phosphate isomerase/epimerase [Candidatus Didemnitutus sp.]|nr:sugar phosphate isomerase/epimerase [Candidatus Didemnitutus sp.]